MGFQFIPTSYDVNQSSAAVRTPSGGGGDLESAPRTLPLSVRQQIDDLIQELQSLDIGLTDTDQNNALAPLAIAKISPQEHQLSSWGGQWRLHLYRSSRSYYGNTASHCFIQAFKEQYGICS